MMIYFIDMEQKKINYLLKATREIFCGADKCTSISQGSD